MLLQQTVDLWPYAPSLELIDPRPFTPFHAPQQP